MKVKMTNDKNRHEFLENYKAWGAWFVESTLGVTYYKCQLPDGKQIVVEESPDTTATYCSTSFTMHHNRYHLICPNQAYCIDEKRVGELLGLIHGLSGEIEIKTFDN
ncbi:MAG TPA: hypothetical protein VHO94_04185 [Oscillospiraceae bacterium]|nr:hypothetical protein [Oscillospiraceae bacterium]